RLGVGPMWNCPECKFEEFFLNSWAAGDPAMLVDVPANTPVSTQQLEAAAVATLLYQPVPPVTGKPTPGPKATKAFYPDDPSNVYHGYQSDPVRFRVLHAGEAVTHVHHLHAHQWLYNPKESGSNYLDSQAIGPGASFTADLVYNGAGNLNRTSGDSIFHCHFYPHFAGGMWALFRVHDVFEAGTRLDGSGRPAAGSRALPDGEITAGTPIPAVIPIPGVAMAPLPAPVHIEGGQAVVPPGSGNPGYPFFVPGLAGHRPPQPPLDFAFGDDGAPIDGGLPRHRIKRGTVAFQKQTVWDFSKESATLVAEELDERGTEPERRAMAAHAMTAIATRTPDGAPAEFKMTGVPPAPGAPFANPAPPGARLRRYKGADIQLDVVLNRKGWHFPQQRMMSLWEDVKPTLAGLLAPTPLFFRANSGEAVEYWHTNLVPSYYELDDFQVRTPTDVLGQHIHLVKFDVTSSDGGSNGFNYEDGTFSPDEVRERIHAINQAGGLATSDGRRRMLAPRPHPYFGAGESGKWVGAQTTIQRWYAEPIIDASGHDRTITTVFTHDHLGPSTHQQAGLYGALVIEPAGSIWTSLDGKVTYGSRALDGGPTSPMANIVTPTSTDSYRELLLEWQDLQLAYDGQSRSRPDCYKVGCAQDPAAADCPLHCLPIRAAPDYRGWADPKHAINAPPFPPDGTQQHPQPQAIALFGAGTFSMNYRSEPIPLRVTPPPAGAAPLPPAQAAEAADLAHAFRSIPRLDPAFNTQPVGGSPIDPACDPTRATCLRYPRQPISAGMAPTDPFTPLFRAYAGDNVQIRAIAGAHTSMHDVVVHGMKWLFEPNVASSGWRASQFDSLSEHFELHVTVPPAALPAGRDHADYLYSPSTSYEGLSNGTWGLLRAFDGAAGARLRPDLQPLPNNPGGSVPGGAVVQLPAGLRTDCQGGQPCLRSFQVSAITAGQALGHPLYYNARGTVVRRTEGGKTVYALDKALPLQDPDALLYVRDEDLDDAGALRPGVPIEPLVLRVNAGDWIRVTLRNCLTGREPPFHKDHATDAAKPSVPYSFPFAGIKLGTSPSVGLHPQLLAYDITRSNGFNLGDNPVQTVPPDAARPAGEPACRTAPRRDYVWYAGSLTPRADGTMQATPIEFGSVNLMPADPLVHHYHGLVGALVVEPAGATWIEDSDARTTATVWTQDGSPLRELVVVVQNDAAIELGGHSFYDPCLPPFYNVNVSYALTAVNYRTEPMFYRF
ncbi:MAG: copper oxidase, partial [Kofleriaceae bacterium]